MSVDKKRLIYIISWAVVLVSLMVLLLATFGYEDEKNVTLAIMFIGIPFGIMIIDMLNFFRFEKYYTAFKFIASNFLLVLLSTFIFESIAILVSFGLKNPQPKLFIFAAAFSLMAAGLNLLQSGFLGLVMKKKH